MECASERYERSGPFTGNRAWLFGAALFGLAGIGAALSAEEAGHAPPAALRSIRVANASVARGRALTNADVRVLVDGRPQPVLSVRMSRRNGEPASSWQSCLGPRPIRSAERNSVSCGSTFVLIDQLTSGAASGRSAWEPVLKVLRDHPEPLPVHVFFLDAGGAALLHVSPSSGHAVLDRMCALLKSSKGSTATQALYEAIEAAGGVVISRHKRPAGIDATSALGYIADHLASSAGRRSVIWLSDRFQLGSESLNTGTHEILGIGDRYANWRLPRLMRAIQRADLAIYAVDLSETRQTAPAPGDSWRIPGAATAGTPPLTSPMFAASRPRGGQASPGEMAASITRATGGTYFKGRGSIRKAIEDAIRHSVNSCSIDFLPEDQRLEGGYRTLAVAIPPGGSHLLYRRFFFDALEYATDEPARNADLADAIWNPLDSTMMRIEAGKELTISADVTGIPSRASGASRELELYWIEFDEDGAVRNRPRRVRPFRYEGGAVALPLRTPLRCRAIRVIARDRDSGRLGSITIAIQSTGIR